MFAFKSCSQDAGKGEVFHWWDTAAVMQRRVCVCMCLRGVSLWMWCMCLCVGVHVFMCICVCVSSYVCTPVCVCGVCACVCLCVSLCLPQPSLHTRCCQTSLQEHWSECTILLKRTLMKLCKQFEVKMVPDPCCSSAWLSPYLTFWSLQCSVLWLFLGWGL